MVSPVVLGSTITDDEFNHLYGLTNTHEYASRYYNYFWVASDLSIWCSKIHPQQDFRDRDVLTMDEFLQYIEQQKLLRILQ